jgi:hypothetical protein
MYEVRDLECKLSLGNIDRWRDRWDLLHALELFIKREYMVLGVVSSIDSTFCVFTHSFLKEVCFALEEGNSNPQKLTHKRS